MSELAWKVPPSRNLKSTTSSILRSTCASVPKSKYSSFVDEPTLEVITVLNVTSSLVPTACPIDTVSSVKVTPVPAAKLVLSEISTVDKVPIVPIPNVVLAAAASASSTNVAPNAEIVVEAGKENVKISESTLPVVNTCASEPVAPAIQ